MNSFVLYMTYTGMFLSQLILIYNGFRSINRYLSGFLFLSSFYIFLQLIIAYSKSEAQVAFFGVGFPTLYYLAGPLGFFYVRGMLMDRNRFDWKDLLHFLPIVFVLAGSLPFILFTGIEEKREVARIIIGDNWTELSGYRPNKFLSTVANEVLKAVQGAFYVVLLWSLLYRNRKKLFVVEYEGEHRKLIRNWLLIFCSMFTLLALMRMVYSWILLQAPAKSDFLEMTYPFHFIGAIGLFGLNIGLILFPGILYGLPRSPLFFMKSRLDSAAEALEEGTEEEKKATEKSTDRYAYYFSEEYLSEIEASVSRWISEERYIEPDWTLARLAIHIDIPYHHLSYYFNFIKNEKYTDWRNRLKIKYACRLLNSGRAQALTMEAIANECGWTSKATFYRIFKQFIGKTPTEYLEELSK